MHRQALNKSAPTQPIFLLQVTFNLLQGGNSFSFLVLFSFVLTIFLLHFLFLYRVLLCLRCQQWK